MRIMVHYDALDEGATSLQQTGMQHEETTDLRDSDAKGSIAYWDDGLAGVEGAFGAEHHQWLVQSRSATEQVLAHGKGVTNGSAIYKEGQAGIAALF